MVPKQLIVAVEGTAAIGPFWQTIVSDYLDKIVRCFCSNETAGQKSTTTHVELSLVMFGAHGSYNACLVQRSGWTRDMNLFFQWLSAIPFCGGGFNDVAIAEGLAEALMMFSSPNGNQNQNAEGQRHCILVAASNPYPLPTPVYQPQPKNSEKNDSDTQPNQGLSDAETLANFFAQFAISLSVICPKQLPKLRGIYNAGKRNLQATDQSVNNVKNPHFLVLISENFMEARTSLGHPGMTSLPSNQNLVKTDVSVPPVAGPPPPSTPSANGSILVQQPVSTGNIHPATVKLEPTTVTSVTVPAFPHISPFPRAASQSVTSLQTSSPISTSQVMIPNNENVPDMKPSVNNVTPSLRPAGGAAANVRILNDVAQARQALARGSSIGLPTMAGTPMLSNVTSSGMACSVPLAQAVKSSGLPGSLPISATGRVQNLAPASLISTASNASTNSSILMSQPLSNLQGSVSLGQTIPGMSQGNLPITHMVQTGMSMNQNLLSGSGASGTGAMVPPPWMTQQGQSAMQPVGVNGNNFMTNVPLNQQASSAIQSVQSKYVKVWEGRLSGQRQGQPVSITRLEGFRNASASETLAANWPPIMQIVRLISQDYMNNKQYVGKADFLVFRALDPHGFLGQLQEKKLCAVIQLSSQTLLLSVSDKPQRLIGMLFPGDMVVFKPQIPNQQQQLQPQLQQQQQNLQQQQQQQNLQQLQQQLLQSQQQQRLLQMQQQPVVQLQPQSPLMQQPQLQHKPQHMVSAGMNQTYIQGGGRSQLLSQGPVSSQGPPTMSGGGSYMS